MLSHDNQFSAFPGMLSLTGFIIFIDHASEEIGNKKNTASQSGSQIDTEFDYGYGISLLMFGTSVIFSEFSGFAYGAFFLHYYRYKYVRRLAKFAVDENGEPLSSGTLEEHIAASSSRCVNESSIDEMNARLCNYRAPSKSCIDLSRGHDQGNGKCVHESVDRRTCSGKVTRREIVKSNSSVSIKPVWSTVTESQTDLPCDANGRGASASQNICSAVSATTVYSRITEV